MDNAAFDDGENGLCELYNILHKIAREDFRIINGKAPMAVRVRDSNGNNCGLFEITEEKTA